MVDAVISYFGGKAGSSEIMVAGALGCIISDGGGFNVIEGM